MLARKTMMAQSGPSYLLRTDFAVPSQPVTLSAGQVLDSTGEGMVVGALTVRSAATVTASITGDAVSLVQAGGDSSALYTAGFDSPNREGDIFIGEMESTSGFSSTVFEFHSSQPPIATPTLGLRVDTSWKLYPGAISVATFTANKRYKLILAHKSGKIYCFIKNVTDGGALTLFYVLSFTARTDLYWIAGIASTLARQCKIHSLRHLQGLYPSLLPDVAAGAYSTTGHTELDTL